MSAFLCSQEHIGALCDAAAAWDVKHPDGLSIPEVFKMLVNENIASLKARYRETAAWQKDAKAFRYVSHEVRPAIEILSLISSYEYQSCEHDLWIVSDAYELCDELRRAAIRKLPGYADAPWAI